MEGTFSQAINELARVASHPSAQPAADMLPPPRLHLPLQGGEGRFPGVLYVIPTETALARGWKMFGVRPVGISDDFVYEEEHVLGEHKYLHIPKLPVSCFKNASNETLIPNLDRILARALPSADAMMAVWDEGAWFTNSALLGPFAEQMQTILQQNSLEEGFIAASAEGKTAFKFAAAIHTATAGEDDALEWVGCPSFPTKFMATLQARVQVIFPEWERPEASHIVLLGAEARELGKEIRAATVSVASGVDITSADTAAKSRRIRQLKAQAHLLGSDSWDTICEAADHNGLEKTLVDLKEHVDNEISEARNSLSAENTGQELAKQSQRIIVKPHNENCYQLTESEVRQLEDFIQKNALKEIDISNAHLLVKAVGRTIVSVQPGGRDLAPVAMPQLLREFIAAARNELCADTGWRAFPEVMLAKIITLRMGPTDNFRFELLGHLVNRDASDEPLPTITVKGDQRDVHAQRARKDLRSVVRSMEDLDVIIRAFASIVKHMFHPSIFALEQVIQVHEVLRAAYDDHSGRTQVSDLYAAFRASVQEHVADIRAAMARGGIGSDVPAISAWQGRSKLTLERAKEAARNACYIRADNGTSENGENMAGQKLATPESMDASVKKMAYKRTSKNTAIASSQKPLPARPALNKSNRDIGGLQQSASAALLVCLKCDKPRNRALMCKAGAWCKIKAHWSARAARFAAALRNRAKVPVVYDIGAQELVP